MIVTADDMIDGCNIVIDNSNRTAIKRNKLSGPAKYLRDNDRLEGRILDYGCGRGDDVVILRAQGYDAIGYDPYWQPTMLAGTGLYDTIVCTYVLNCISDQALINNIVKYMSYLTSEEGSIYISVRNDIKNLNGYTEKGTYQAEVNVASGYVEEIVKNSTFKMWRLGKGDRIGVA